MLFALGAFLNGCATAPKITFQNNVHRTIASYKSSFNLETLNLTPSQYAQTKLMPVLPLDFIQKITNTPPSNEFRNDVVQKILLGYMKKGNYGAAYSKYAVSETKKILKKHSKTFKAAEKLYGVDPAVISALLRVETKHGTYTGKTPVLQALFSLLQADHPLVLQETFLAIPAIRPEPTQMDLDKVKERAKTKSDWAMNELIALYKMSSTRKMKVEKLQGSYAGAFGNAQFMPSSYLEWAVSPTSKNPDLFKLNDAIFSVANYLNKHGWVQDKPETHGPALLSYNHAQGYVDVILKIADEARTGTDTRTASTKPN